MPLEEIPEMETPGKMTFDEVLVRVADEEKDIYEGEKKTGEKERVVRVEFGWFGLSDSLVRKASKVSKSELDDFLERFKPFHGKRCKVTFNVACQRNGNWSNTYRLVDVSKIAEVSDTPTRSRASASAGA